jgi:LytS/YehU family sensor histidine kinase
VLTVTNTMDPGASAAADPLPDDRRTGIGLSNSRERLRHRFGDGASLVAGPTSAGYRAMIRFPFVLSQAH